MIDKLNPLYAKGVRPIPVIPTVYTDALSYGEQLGIMGHKTDECVDKVNEVIEDNETFKGDITEQQDEFEDTMQGQYTQFLEDYQRQFGVVQELGTSTTDVISQKGMTDELGKVVYKPNNSFGEAGQVLESTGVGVKWSDVGAPTQSQVKKAVDDWLDAHPEATTSVEDHSLTNVKLVIGTLDYVTPEMFGAVGDGLTDDTVAIQNCLNHGGNIVGNGTYLIKQSLVPASNSTIIGLKIISDDNENNVINCNNVTNVDFIQCIIIGDDVLNTTDNYHKNAIVCANCSDIKILECEISHMGGSCIYLTECDGVIIDKNIFYDNDNSTLGREVMVGYGADYNKGVIVSNNRCLSETQMGIIVQGSNDEVTVCDNYVADKHGYGIAIYGFGGYNTNITVENNYVKNVSYNETSGYYNGMGIYCVTVKNYKCSRNIVENVLLDRPDTSNPNRTLNPAAIAIGTGEKVLINDNIIINSKIEAIALTDGTDCVISNNYCGADVEGIYTYGNNIKIVNNTIKNGLFVVNSYQCNNLLIDNNIIEKTLSMRASTYVTETLIITNNKIIGEQLNILSLALSNNVLVSNNMITCKDDYSSNKIGMRFGDCTNVIVTGNIVGHNTLQFYELIRFETASNGVCSNNILKNVSQNHAIMVYDTSIIDVINNKYRSEKVSSEYIGINAVGQPNVVVTIELGSAEPSAGYHAKGSMVINNGSGTNTGWICTTAGTPGTWSSFTLS